MTSLFFFAVSMPLLEVHSPQMGLCCHKKKYGDAIHPAKKIKRSQNCLLIGHASFKFGSSITLEVRYNHLLDGGIKFTNSIGKQSSTWQHLNVKKGMTDSHSFIFPYKPPTYCHKETSYCLASCHFRLLQSHFINNCGCAIFF